MLEHHTAVDSTGASTPAQGAIAQLERFAAGRGGPMLVGLWAFGEAIVLPVVPDVALGLLVLAAPGRAAVLFAALVAGSLAGTAVLYGWVLAAPDAATSMILALPGIDGAMLDGARAAVATGDPFAIALFGPGTPLKVDTFAWATGPASPLALALGVVVNRVTRVGPGLVVVALLGRFAPGLVRRQERLVLVAYATFWVALYALYLS